MTDPSPAGHPWLAWRLGLLCFGVLVGCHRSDPGISKEKAEAILHGFGFVNFDLGPTPDGWLGSADRGSDTYRIRVSVDHQGVINWDPR